MYQTLRRRWVHARKRSPREFGAFRDQVFDHWFQPIARFAYGPLHPNSISPSVLVSLNGLTENARVLRGRGTAWFGYTLPRRWVMQELEQSAYKAAQARLLNLPLSHARQPLPRQGINRHPEMTGSLVEGLFWLETGLTMTGRPTYVSEFLETRRCQRPWWCYELVVNNDEAQLLTFGCPIGEVPLTQSQPLFLSIDGPREKVILLVGRHPLYAVYVEPLDRFLDEVRVLDEPIVLAVPKVVRDRPRAALGPYTEAMIDFSRRVYL